jgi:two-component sensor histidine kinase
MLQAEGGPAAGISKGRIHANPRGDRIRHAYSDKSGEIQVTVQGRGAELHVEVADQGVGLPVDFDMDQPRASLGFKVIKSLLAQLNGRIAVASNKPSGTTIQLDVPLD